MGLLELLEESERDEIEIFLRWNSPVKKLGLWA